MGVLDIVTITQQVVASFAAAEIGYSACGIVGSGMANEAEAENYYLYTRLDKLYDRHGDGGLYRAALQAFNNGMSHVHAVQCTSVAEGSDELMTGDDAAREFAFALTSAVNNALAPGSLQVIQDPLGESGTAWANPNARTLAEGIDFQFDYSKSTIHFNLPPPAPEGGNTYTVKANYRYIDAAANDVEDALAVLVDKNVQLVSLGYMFKPTYMGKLKTHVVTAESAGYYREGFGTGAHNDATTLPTTATSEAHKRMFWVGNRSGFKGQPAAASTPASQSWLEFRDLSPMVMGRTAAIPPWEDLHFKAIKGSNWYGQFTAAELGDFDTAGTLLGAFVNVLDDPRYLPGSDAVLLYARVSDAEVTYLDVQRTIDYVDGRLKAVLHNPSITGKAKMNRPGTQKVYNVIWNELVRLYAEGAIENPKDLADTHDGVMPIDIEVYWALKKSPSKRTKEENDLIQTEQGDRKMTGRVNYDFAGSIQTYEFDLAAR